MLSENLQEIEINTFQRPMPEINRLKFPKYELILPLFLQGGSKQIVPKWVIYDKKAHYLTFPKLFSHIFIEISSENLEDFEHFHFPATNCVSKKIWHEALIRLVGRP